MNHFNSSLLSVMKISLIACFLFISNTSQAQIYNAKKFENEIQAFDKRDTEEKVKSGSNLFVGSSSITFWKDIADYFPKSYVINRGFGGSKFEDLLYYADRVIMPYKPEKIFIYEGDNDINDGFETKVLIEQAKELRNKIAAAFPKVPVVFISAKPSIARWKLKDKYVEFNKALKKYAKREKHTDFVDVWTPMIDSKGMVFNDVFLDDDLHMKANGYKIWQKALEPHVLKNK